MSIVPTSELRTYIGDVTESECDCYDAIHSSVEAFVKNYCNRTFESTPYTKQKYSGKGFATLQLDDFPLTAVDRVSIGIIDVIRIKNTNSNSTASVSVTSTGLRLVKDGTADTSVTFASNTTLTAIVSAINGVSGWSAELLTSNYGSFKSSELLEWYGLNAINNNWVYLRIPDDAEDEFEVDLERGWIIKRSGWPKGWNNIVVDYTAGYSASNMPEDLKEAIKHFIKVIYNKKVEESFGLKEYRIGVNSILSVFDGKDMPQEIKSVLSYYRRVKV